MTNDNQATEAEANRAVKTVAMSNVVRTMDGLVQTLPEPEEQIAVLMIVIAKAFARLLWKHKIIDGPRKKNLMHNAMKDFEIKIRKFGWTPQPPTSQIVTPDSEQPRV